jgi:hypothetical protein
MVRPDIADDTVLVVRAIGSELEAAAAVIADDAGLSAEVYVVETADATREVLFGVSVFARTPGLDVDEVLGRFPHAESYLETTAGQLRSAGFPVYPTGSNVAHHDIQLVAGVTEQGGQPDEATIMKAARRVVEMCGVPHSNPFYAGIEEAEDT